MKGYKVFEPDWTCRGFQYKEGETYAMEASPIPCARGFHFCKNLADCFSYYSFDPNNKVAEIEAIGDITSGDGGKSCTNKISIVREMTWEEVLQTVNTGKGCTGLCNTGDRNTGNRNTGDRNTGNRNTGDRNTGNWNTGNWNTGDWNTGDWNTGDRNTGDRNTGDRNTGNWNTGNWNTGDWNTGDWNTTSFSSGCFCTEESKILMFNRQSNWTMKDWLRSEARSLLCQIPHNVVEWIWSDDMTDEEKEAHPEHTTTGGYLKILEEAENAQNWWSGLSESDRNVIRSIPNFDPAIFKQCTGIDVNK